MTEVKAKTLGSAIDEILSALDGLDESLKITALRTVQEHLKLSVVPARAQETDAGSGAGHHPQMDIRSFKDAKQPSGLIEMACVMAYYLQNIAPEAERKNQVEASDITKYFVQANYPLPKVAKQVLVDAKAAGYLDSAGSAQYRLNPVGHNLVNHTLPRAAQGSVDKPSRRAAKRTKPSPRKKK